MSAIKYAENLKLVRSIQKELRLAIAPSKGADKTKRVKDDPAVQHMLGVLRENQVTERRFCRPQDHYKYFAETYLTYLRSLRLQGELTNKYFNKGDRSIKDSARLVGLELPKLNTTNGGGGGGHSTTTTTNNNG